MPMLRPPCAPSPAFDNSVFVVVHAGLVQARVAGERFLQPRNHGAGQAVPVGHNTAVLAAL
eukprot:36004-Eustigmatos_ZCMA.PRE.1